MLRGQLILHVAERRSALTLNKNLSVKKNKHDYITENDILSLDYFSFPRVVTGDKNSPTVAHACRKRRLKWVLGAWGYNWTTQSPGDINMETWSSRLGVGAQG
jgi:hypothetical protein